MGHLVVPKLWVEWALDLFVDPSCFGNISIDIVGDLRIYRQVMSIKRQIRHRATPLLDLATHSLVSGTASDWEPDSFVPPHHHSVSQLIYAATGVITVETAQGIWVVPHTRAVWVPACTGHSIKVSGNVQLRTLQFGPDIRPIDTKKCSVVQVSPLLRAGIIRAMDFPGDYGADSPEGRLASVILDEIRSAVGASIAPLHLPMPTDARARRVAVEFCADPSNRQACKAWAHAVGASERTLERRFHTETGMSFGKWQQHGTGARQVALFSVRRRQARLLKALEILAAGQSVTVAAYDVGFKSPSAFIVMFRSAMGDTPSRYFSS